MKGFFRFLAILVFGGMSITHLQAQVTSGSSTLVAQPIPDRSISFSVLDAGVTKPVSFGLDLAWLSAENVRRGIAFMGRSRVKLIRSSFTPTDSLINGDLKPHEMAILNQRLNIINTYMGPTAVALNDDNPSISPWFKNADGTVNAARWEQLMAVTARYHRAQGDTIVTVGPFNEPDYTPNGQGTMQDFYNIATVIKSDTLFNNVRLGGGNTLSCDAALPWYNFLKPLLDEGNTHQLAGSFDNFANFYRSVSADGRHATGDEMHNVMEAMVGAEYGLQTGIWWGTAELARGEFVKASDGVRLGYAEDRPNWTAASVYRSPNGKVQAFGGTSERQAATTRYRFVSKDRDVYYDGYGPQREFSLLMPGGTGYQQGQTNAERVVNITWGDDIQPVINGRYMLVNRGSGKVAEVPGGSTTAGTFLQQNSYSGASYQQWNVGPVDSRIGGDFSYFTLSNVNSGKVPDVYNWSLDNGGKIDAWDDTKGANQQWYLDYAGDGWFYIRSRYSARCIEVSSDGLNLDQWEVNGGANQQWRFLPVNAAVEFNAPPAPTGLLATANAESIRLSWTPSAAPDLGGYTIFRSQTAGGSYNTIARNVTTTSYVDNTATSGGPYYYVIRAVDQSLNRSPFSSEVSATPTGSTDLAEYLPFNGNTLDSSVNLNHAAPYGGYSYVQGIVGSKAIALNGSDAFVQLPATVAGQPKMTVAAWVLCNGGGAWQRIFDFGNDQSQYLFLTPNSGAGTLRFAIKNGGAEQTLDAPALAAGTWTHVAVTLDSGGAKLYVNGQMAAQSGSINIWPADFKPVLNYIGRSQYADPLFNGSVDEFRIYNYALSDSEVAQLAARQDTINPHIASGDNRITLTWDPKSNVQYTISRSAAQNGRYDTIARSISGARYDDSTTSNNSTYYYNVAANAAAAGGRVPPLLVGTPVFGQHVYMSFNEAAGAFAEDIWGGYHGMLAATATHGAGYNGNGVKLDGSPTSYVSLASGLLTNLNDFTVSAWVRMDAISTGMRIFDFGSDSIRNMSLTAQAGVLGTKSIVRYAIKNKGIEQQVNYNYDWPLSSWVHVAVSRSDSALKLYIDGIQVASNNNNTIRPSELGIAVQNYIGKSRYDDPLLKGSVDEFKIFDYALSAQSIASLANLQSGTVQPTAPSVSETKMYPNPVHDHLVIQVSEWKKGTTFRLFNSMGALVLIQPLAAGANDINLKNLAPGLYFAQISNGQFKATQKIVKE